jgi:hypothetical protein
VFVSRDRPFDRGPSNGLDPLDSVPRQASFELLDPHFEHAEAAAAIEDLLTKVLPL